MLPSRVLQVRGASERLTLIQMLGSRAFLVQAKFLSQPSQQTLQQALLGFLRQGLHLHLQLPEGLQGLLQAYLGQVLLAL